MRAKADAIAEQYRQRIRNGDLSAGAEVPAIDDLVVIHGVARATAQRAYNMLRDEGFIITKQGRNAVVLDQTPPLAIRWDAYDKTNRERSGETTFERQCRARGEEPRTVHNVGTKPCPDWAAEYLGVASGESVVTHWGQGYSAPRGPEGTPDPGLERVIAAYITIIPPWVAEAVPDLAGPRGHWIGGIYSMAENGTGTRITERRVFIEGRESTLEETELFGLPRPVPILVEDLVALTEDGRVAVLDRNLKLIGSARWEFLIPVGD